MSDGFEGIELKIERTEHKYGGSLFLSRGAVG
jgi:hypothetical protein